MDNYQNNALTTKQKQNLLASIKVDITHGAERTRAIGPTLSAKIYHFFTDEDGERMVN